jgi:dienelactone hydrolase
VLGSAAAADPPFKGPYSSTHKLYQVSTLDSSDPEAVIVYPTNTDATKFPILSYAHGAAGGGWYTFEGYYALWTQIASHGFIIVAPKSCSVGCKDGGWDTYYEEQLKVLEWAKNMSNSGTDKEIFGKIDWTSGAGIVGHSMGGQATVRSAKKDFADKYNIKAAVLHHPFYDKNTYGAEMAVPTAAFTGTADHTCPPQESHEIWDLITVKPKTFANRIGANHLEPVLVPPIEHPELGMYTAAWFKIFLKGDAGIYHSLIYGNATDPNSLCRLVPMEECINDI